MEDITSSYRKELADIQYTARDLVRMQNDNESLFSKLTTINQQAVERLSAKYVTASEREPINFIRKKCLRLIQEGTIVRSDLKKFEQTINEERSSQWNLFRALHPILIEDVKGSQIGKIKQIQDDIAERLDIPDFKIHTAYFDEGRNFGGTRTWWAFYHPNFKSHEDSLQLFFSIEAERIVYGTYAHQGHFFNSNTIKDAYDFDFEHMLYLYQEHLELVKSGISGKEAIVKFGLGETTVKRRSSDTSSLKEEFESFTNEQAFEKSVERDSAETEEVSKESPKEQLSIVNGTARGFRINEKIDAVIGAADLANEMADLIKNLDRADKGTMIGIFGNWGRGKTFLMNEIWNVLKGNQGDLKFERVDFHAWKFQDTPASWAYLYEAFSNKYYDISDNNRLRERWEQIKRTIRLNVEKRGPWPFIWLFVEILVLFLLAGVLVRYSWIEDTPDSDTSALQFILPLSGLGLALAFPAVDTISKLVGSFKTSAKMLFRRYYNRPNFKELLGVQAEIQEELKSLLKAWIPEAGKNKVLLVVDDIDRCEEERIIQIIDSLRVMLEDGEISERVVVLAAIDERVLKRIIKWKYHDILEKDPELDEIGDKLNVSRQLIREYMDKLFLSGIKLGTLTGDERKEIFSAFAKDKVEIIESKKLSTSGVKKQLGKGESSSSGDHFDDIKNGYDESDINRGTELSLVDETDNSVEKSEEEVEKLQTFELSKTEHEELLELLGSYNNATPRQIRIFYYRYLLARNLLLRKNINLLKTEESDNIKGSLLGNLLLHYSLEQDPHGIGNDKADLVRWDEENDKQPKIVAFDHSPQYSKAQLLDVYNVLELVIAY